MANGAVIPVMQGNPKALAEADRAQLLDLAQHYRSMGNEWLRRMIVVENRIDILALAVLDYQIQPFHLALLRWQFLHPDNLQLVFRGAVKSTVCTITKTLHLLAKDPNLDRVEDELAVGSVFERDQGTLRIERPLSRAFRRILRPATREQMGQPRD